MARVVSAEKFTLTDDEVEALLAFYSSEHFPDGTLVWGDTDTDFEANPPPLRELGALCHRLYHWYREHGNW